MKTRIMICTLVIMFSAFAGSIWRRQIRNTYYGMSARSSTPPGSYNAFIGENLATPTPPVIKTPSSGMARASTTPQKTSSNTFLGYHAGSWDRRRC